MILTLYHQKKAQKKSLKKSYDQTHRKALYDLNGHIPENK